MSQKPSTQAKRAYTWYKEKSVARTELEAWLDHGIIAVRADNEMVTNECFDKIDGFLLDQTMSEESDESGWFPQFKAAGWQESFAAFRFQSEKDRYWAQKALIDYDPNLAFKNFSRTRPFDVAIPFRWRSIKDLEVIKYLRAQNKFLKDHVLYVYRRSRADDIDGQTVAIMVLYSHFVFILFNLLFIFHYSI